MINKSTECRAERITFVTIASKQNQCNRQPEEIADDKLPEYAPKICIRHINTRVHSVFIHGLKLLKILSTDKEIAGQILPCVVGLIMWTGVGGNLQPS